MKPALDIIVPAYNGLDITARCLASLWLFAPPESRVILVDNGSTEAIDSLNDAVLARSGVFVRLGQNRGPYGAVNAGLDMLRAEHVAIVCNDVVVLPYSLGLMLGNCTEEHPYIGANQITGPHFDFHACEAHIEQAGFRDDARAVAGAYFTCCVMHRSLLDKVGRFDEQFRLTYGDTDWEQRASDVGGDPIRMVAAPVFHGHSMSRKRLGFEADVVADTADYDRFAAKWGHRPDVMAKHPRLSPEQRQRGTEMLFKQGEKP